MNTQIETLLDIWKAAHSRGVTLTVEQLCSKYPELKAELQARLSEIDAPPTDGPTPETEAFALPPTSELSTAPTVPPSNTAQFSKPHSSDFNTPQISGYQIERELGRGGMGIVYQATDISLQRPVAIKMSLTQSKVSAQTRFQTEAAALARLQHPNIVQVHAAGSTMSGQTYFVMEYVAGGSLADLVGKRPQPIVESARLVQLLAKAVHAAHQRGIVHRDLKPANVLMAPPSDEPALNCAWGSPKIADFGLVKLLDNLSAGHQATTTGDVLGTPSYMAPEQARSGKAIGPAVDIYALGAILYCLLAGRPPFQGGTSIDVILKVLEEDPPPLREVRPEVPEALVAICERCLRKNPAERYGSAAELAGDLQKAMSLQPAISATLVEHDNTGRQLRLSTKSGQKEENALTEPMITSTHQRGKLRWLLASLGMVILAIGLGLRLTHFLQMPSGNIRTTSIMPTQASAVAIDEAFLVQTLHHVDQIQKVETENRKKHLKPCRTQLTFDVEDNGAMVQKELPFIIGVIGDFSGHADRTIPLAGRKFLDVDRDNLNTIMAAKSVRLRLQVPRIAGIPGTKNDLELDLSFKAMESFEPIAVARQIPALRELLEERKQCMETGNAERIVQIDQIYSKQLIEVIQHPEYLHLEATWRGLYYLVVSAETGLALKIRCFDANKQELIAEMDRVAHYERTTLFRTVFENEYGVLGGTPLGLLIGDYEFGPGRQDVELLQSIGETAARSQVPFVATAGPQFFGLARYSELNSVTDLSKKLTDERYALWNQFRKTIAAKYVALALPRVLVRLPFGKANYAVEGIAFEENSPSRDRLPWMSAVWVLAVQVARAHAQYGWLARITAENGAGSVEGLPILYDEPRETNQSVDCVLTLKQARELTKLGFLPLFHQNKRGCFFLEAHTTFQAGSYADEKDQERDRLSTDFPTLLCTTRFTNYCMVMARNKIGSFSEAIDVERWLSNWISYYTLSSVADYMNTPDDALAKTPLAPSQLLLRESKLRAEQYEIVARLRPIRHFTQIPKTEMELIVPLPQVIK
ncbi:MAG TPA: type VI secretion system contractile sheath large subunit [Gemmatales bacterium]|nr:type VI secretion system contractile sheath large subunit [Gemmatales bacterium]